MVKQSELEKYKPQSRRFKKYSRDKSQRGRSLALAALLVEIKKSPDFQDFEPILRDAINQVRGYGSQTEKKRERVIESLKTYACEISEIADETRIDKTEVRNICIDLVKEGLVRADYRTHGRELGDNRVELFFWRENDTKQLSGAL